MTRERKGKGFLSKLSGAVLILELLAFIVVTGLLVIGEVWVPAQKDSYVYPQAQIMESTQLKVADSYQLQLPQLGENETVSRIVASNPDILTVSEDNVVTANALWGNCDVKIYVSEKQIPERQPRYRDVKILGIDLSSVLNGLHDQVRDFLKIEMIEEPRTQLRDLAIYEYDFVVDELSENALSSLSQTKLYVGDSRTLSIEVPEGCFVSDVKVSDESLAKISVSKNSEGKDVYTLNVLKAGQFNVIYTVSRTIMVSEEEYQTYQQFISELEAGQ